MISRTGPALALLLAGSACVHVPKEAPELSRELAGRIQDLQAAHLATVRLYMDVRRAQVDRFIQDEWIPAFAKNAMGDPAIQRVVEGATTPAARLEVFVVLGQRIQKQIDKRRTEMMRPIDEMERDLLSQIQRAYGQVTAGNAALTALLEAHAATTETQDRVLKELKVDKDLASSLSKVEQVIGLMTEGTNALEQNKEQIRKLLDSLRP